MAGRPSSVGEYLFPQPEWHPVDDEEELEKLPKEQAIFLRQVQTVALKYEFPDDVDTYRLVCNLMLPMRLQPIYLSLRNFFPKIMIASGNNGAIYRARPRFPDIKHKFVVLKQFKTTTNAEINLPLKAAREMAIHYSVCGFRHLCDNVVQAFAFADGPEAVLLVMEYIPFSLAKFIDRLADDGHRLTIREVHGIMGQLFHGLHYIHGRGIMHRDLNPSNILFGADYKVKICDFGEARKYNFGRDITPRVGTIWWRAPEICLSARTYGYAADMWSAGLILGELLLLESVLQGDNDVQMIDLQAKLIGKPDAWALRFLARYSPFVEEWRNSESWSKIKSDKGTLETKFAKFGPETIAVLRGLLAWNPSARWSAEEAWSGFSPPLKKPKYLGRFENSKASHEWFDIGKTGEDRRPTDAQLTLLSMEKQRCMQDYGKDSDEYNRVQAQIQKAKAPATSQKATVKQPEVFVEQVPAPKDDQEFWQRWRKQCNQAHAMQSVAETVPGLPANKAVIDQFTIADRLGSGAPVFRRTKGDGSQSPASDEYVISEAADPEEAERRAAIARSYLASEPLVDGSEQNVDIEYHAYHQGVGEAPGTPDSISDQQMEQMNTARELHARVHDLHGLHDKGNNSSNDSAKWSNTARSGV